MMNKIESFSSTHAYKDHHGFLNAKLANRITDLALYLFGEPTHVKYYEWRYGINGELSILISGSKSGQFVDFKTGKFGDCIDLIAFATGLQGNKLFKWIEKWLNNKIARTVGMKLEPISGGKASNRSRTIISAHILYFSEQPICNAANDNGRGISGSYFLPSA